ncbi:hypothetical protein PAPYR_7126 [Paratrimastix pyriformis]|uniref:Uncharacterized protein n=1 Tax=Paratrimastix pyriformis TaxID=342808 RepID=A0ABQ8UDR1_9EUKA|nr:hypothetical protein PAPYR_7126 [Paratrimastix pyriformis]
MSAHPFSTPSFIPTHLLNRSTIKFQLAWHARPSKSPKRTLSLATMISEPVSLSKPPCPKSTAETQRICPDVASLCRIPIPGIVLHPTIEVFPKVGVLLCSFPHEVVPFGGVFLLEVVPLGVFLRVRPHPADVAQRCPLRLSPTAGFSSFLSRCRPAMPLEVVPDGGVFLLLEVVPIGVFLVPLGEVCLPHFSQVVLDPLWPPQG